MASLFNSKHNKYFSTPDWFKDTVFDKQDKQTTQTIYMGGAGGGGSQTGLSNISIYNKFVLEQVELNNEALVNTNTALNTTDSEEQKIGDALSVEGWGTTGYTSIASGTTMTVVSQIIEGLSNQYGIIFYDHSITPISVHYLTAELEEVTIPNDAYSFRISTPSGYDLFKVIYFKSKSYTNEQLHLSNLNVSSFLELNADIPEGINETTFTDTSLKLLVQSPLQLVKDKSNVIKLSVGDIAGKQSNEFFTWDKKLAAFGYNKETNQAYSYLEGEQQFTTDDQGNQIPIMTDNPEFWLYDEALSDKWIIKSTRPRISWLDNLFEYDEEKSCFKLHGNLLVTGGVTMYATDNSTPGGDAGDEDDSNKLPENMEVLVEELKKTFVTTTEEVQDIEGVKNFTNGLSIGNRRMYEWKDDVIYLDSNLVVRGGITMYGNASNVDPNEWYTSLPVANPLYWDYSSGSPVLTLSDAIGSIDSISVTGNGNAITNATLTDNGRSISFTKSITFATDVALQKKADKEYVDQNFVTLTTQQTINGRKDFVGGLLVNGNEIVYDDSTECWKLNGNLLVSGGITMYNIDPISVPSFMQSLLLDDETLELNAAGELTVKSKGGIDENQLQQLLDSWGYVTDDKSLKNPYSLSWSGYSSGSYDGSSEKNIVIPSDTNHLTNGAGFVTEDALTPYALENWVSGVFDNIDARFTEINKTVDTKWTQDDSKINNWNTAFGWGNHASAGYSTQTYVDQTFVTLTTEQTISGKKNFTTGGLFVNGNQIVYNSSKGYWKLDGDLLITGGITMYGSESGFNSSSIMDAVLTDGKTIRVNPYTKQLEVIETSSGGVDEDAVRDLIESYNYLTEVKSLNISNSAGTNILSYDGKTSKSLTLSKSHVGLSNVENTALSTWTGSTYIDKVGTITSGTWNGNSIGASYLPTASTTTKGIASFSSSYFSVSSGVVSFTGANVQIVSSLPSSRTKNTLYVITG